MVSLSRLLRIRCKLKSFGSPFQKITRNIKIKPETQRFPFLINSHKIIPEKSGFFFQINISSIKPETKWFLYFDKCSRDFTFIKIHLWRHSFVSAHHYFQEMACYGSATLLEVMESWFLWNQLISRDTGTG